jgi:signal transduction histidine kinase/PAS domain-containing protein
VVFYTVADREGVKRLGQVYRWDRQEGGLVSLADELRVLPNIPVLENWISIISQGGCIRLRQSDYSEGEAAFLRVYGITSILLLPVFTRGTLWGAVSFQDHTNDRYFDEGCADLLHSAARIFSNAIIREEVRRSAEETFKALERREKMVAALNRAAVKFLSYGEETFEDTMTAGVKEIADVFKLDRFSLLRNFTMPDGSRHGGQIYRWNRESGGTTVPLKGLESFSPDQYVPNWRKILTSGGTINSPVRLLPEAAILQSFGLVSICVTPVFINNIYWGIAFFEDLHTERFFDLDLVEMMRSAAFLCANTVMRADMEREVAYTSEFTRSVLDASPLSFSVFDENARVIDCNDATLKAMGTTKEYFLEHFFEFSPEYQNDGVKSEDKAAMVIKRALNSEKLVFEWTHCSSAGELIPYEVTLVRTMYKGKLAALGYQYDLRNTKKMTESIRKQSELLKIRLEQQELLSEISRGFISSGESETLVREAIAKLGHYHKVSLVFIFAMDFEHCSTYPAYHWSADGSPPRLAKYNMFDFIKSSFPEILPDCSTMPIITCEDTSANQSGLYQALAAINVMSLIATPLYVDGRLWGIMNVEQCSVPRRWTENEKGFVAITASTIAGVIMRDIYNTKLKEALHKATEASKAKSDFLSNMSHEMRTPLNAITGMTAIGRNAKDMERKDYALGKIQDASTHLLGVINDVLDMSKIEANMLELSPIEFNFEKMLQNTAAVVNFRVEEKRQKLTVHIDRKIPQMLIADDQRLAQVVTNLLSNAVKFTPEEGDITLNANFLGEENGVCTIQVDVSDTGIGISGEQQKRLFSSFQQAESGITRKYGGTGLGLAISKKIVEMMDGRIWVLSEPEKGSTFSFIIKARRGEEDWQKSLPDANLSNIHILGIDKRQAETTPPADITGIFTGRRILLVEDIEINREIVQALLEPTRLEIDCAENGVQAVRMFSEAPQKYDMIFMDVQMPEMDGYEATRRIRALDNPKAKNIPIIAMTANVFREDIEKCLEAGMSSHIGKPLNFDTVLEKLRAYLPVS